MIMNIFHYDLFVVGTGEAGTTAAIKASSYGWKTAIADKREYGGTCALRGCNPKRTMAGAAEIIYRSRHMHEKGITGDIKLDWNSLKRFTYSLIEKIPSFTEERLSSKGIDLFHGEFYFTAPNSMSNGNVTIEASHILIATGSVPKLINVPGNKYITHIDDLLKVDKLPRSMVFIGAGYISIEFAHILGRIGTNITIIESMSHALNSFDNDLTDMLKKASDETGIKFFTDCSLEGIEKTSDNYTVHTKDGQFKTDMIVHGAGRIPDIENLKLENAGIENDKGNIIINEYLQCTSNTAVYVAGDVTGRSMRLTPVAEMEGEIAAFNMINGNCKIPDYHTIPSVVFSHPSVASVGLREENLGDNKNLFNIYFQNTSEKHITKRHGLNYSAFKIITEKENDKIRGVHLLGHNCDEVINGFSLAIRQGLTINDLKETIWTFPSVMYDIVSRLAD